MGKKFESVEIIQEKSLNMDKKDFIENLLSKKVIGAHNKGKWIFLELSGDSNLLLNLGMGADILFHNAGNEWPEKYQCRFQFNDQSGFTCRFWWFGHVEFVTNQELNEHKPTKNIAISPLDPNFTDEHFTKLIKGRSQIKKPYFKPEKNWRYRKRLHT